jgi:hypothetical protein
MCLQWQQDLTAATAQVVKDKDAIQGIVLASNKTTFFAGADLKGTMRLQPADAPEVFRGIEQVKKNFRTLETLGKPVVACLNGSALGGGWEVALIGHYRVAVDDPKIQFGLPEVTLGLIPGASGITKMTRLLGLAGAQPYVLESKLFGPREALELGLVHELGQGREPVAPGGAGLDRNASAGPAAVGRQEIPDAGRHPGQPRDRRHAERGARGAAPEDARPLPGAGSRAGRDGRRRAGRLRHRAAHRKPLPGEADRDAGGEEHDQHVLLQHERDQVRPVAAEGRAALQAAEGGHPRRRHDGRRHRLRPGQPRHRHRAEGRFAREGPRPARPTA